jgi:serine/threonine protein kinase
MAVTLSCPTCRAQLELRTEPPPGAVGRCPWCQGAVPFTPTDPRTQTYLGHAETGGSAPATTHTYSPQIGGGKPLDTSFLAPPEQPDEIGRLGLYRILARLGSGGMGVVFRAEEPELKREVALKVMLPHLASNPTWKARFVREARAQAAVQHDHVVTIHRVDEDHGVAFIVMPLLKGQTLGAALKQNPRPPLKEVLRIGREMAEGLAAAHEAGLIHRDIKPSNVWLDGRRRAVKILDFGLARAAEGTELADAPAHSSVSTDGSVEFDLTVQGAVVGTPTYMSPEQARGDKVDSRTDLFSLGTVLYQMATGTVPFLGATTRAILNAVEQITPPPPSAIVPTLPVSLSDLILRLLEKKVGDRPQSAEQVAEELRELETACAAIANLVALPVPAENDPWSDLDTDEPGSASDVIPTRRPIRAPEPRPARMWVVVLASVAAACVLVGLVGAVVLKLTRTPPADRADAEAKVTPGEPRSVGPPPTDPRSTATTGSPSGTGSHPPDLSAQTPVTRLNFTAGQPPDGPNAFRDPDGGFEWGYAGSVMWFKTTGGVWYASGGNLPRDAAIEIRARVTSEDGAWAFDPVGVGTGRPVISVTHQGELTIGPLDDDETEVPERTVPHRAIKKRGEWNTLLLVVRADRMDFYVNGEEVARAVPVRAGGDKQLYFGIAADGDATVEYQRITVWNLPPAAKK